jgi:Mor family transcriptional regulator
MTLQYIADKHNVPVDMLASELKIPKTLVGEKLGRLKKRYNFTMNDVRTIISKNKGVK